MISNYFIFIFYSLAFVLGLYMTEADIFGYGWRSVYVICAIPGLVMGVLIALFLRDPRYKAYQLTDTQVKYLCLSKNRKSYCKAYLFLVMIEKVCYSYFFKFSFPVFVHIPCRIRF